MFHNICLQCVVPPVSGAFELGCDWFMDVRSVWGLWLLLARQLGSEILQIHFEKFTSNRFFSWSEYDMNNKSLSRRKRSLAEKQEATANL